MGNKKKDVLPKKTPEVKANVKNVLSKKSKPIKVGKVNKKQAEKTSVTNTVKVGDTFVLRAEYIPSDNSMNVLSQFGGSAVDLVEISDQSYPTPGGGYSRFYKFQAVRPGLQVIQFASYNPENFVMVPTMLYEYSVVD